MTENLPNETKTRSKGITLTTRTQHKHPRRTILTKQPPQPPVLLPKAAIRLHRLANEPRRRLLLFQLPSRCLFRPAPRCSRRPKTRPLLHLWPSHLHPLRARASPGEAASINLDHREPSTSPGQTTSTTPSSSSPPSDSGASIMPAPAPPLVPASPDGSGRRSQPVLGLASRQFKATLRGAGATEGGNTRERAAEKEKEREPAKDGPSSPKREAEEGGRKTMHGRGAGLLQIRSLMSDLFPQSSSARPSRPHHARRSKLHQRSLYRTLWRLPTLSRLPPRVSDMVDDAEEGAEAEAEEDHRRLRIHEASAPP